MLQRRPNKELRSMDSHFQILCKFQTCKQKVPLACTEKKFPKKPILGAQRKKIEKKANNLQNF